MTLTFNDNEKALFTFLHSNNTGKPLAAVRTLADASGVSKSAVDRALKKARTNGAIKKGDNFALSLAAIKALGLVQVNNNGTKVAATDLSAKKNRADAKASPASLSHSGGVGGKEKKGMFDLPDWKPSEPVPEEMAPGKLQILPKASGQIHYIAIKVLHNDPNNPRKIGFDANIKQLAGSIADQGLLENLVARPDPDNEDQYILVAGNRRLAALTHLMTTKEKIQGVKVTDTTLVPVKVIDITEEEALITALTENVARDDMNDLDLGEAFVKVRDLAIERDGETAGGKVSGNLAKKFGRNKKWVQDRMGIADNVCEEAKQAHRDHPTKMDFQRLRILKAHTTERQQKAVPNILKANDWGWQNANEVQATLKDQVKREIQNAECEKERAARAKDEEAAAAEQTDDEIAADEKEVAERKARDIKQGEIQAERQKLNDRIDDKISADPLAFIAYEFLEGLGDDWQSAETHKTLVGTFPELEPLTELADAKQSTYRIKPGQEQAAIEAVRAAPLNTILTYLAGLYNIGGPSTYCMFSEEKIDLNTTFLKMLDIDIPEILMPEAEPVDQEAAA